MSRLILDAALAYARHGRRVFPCRARSKAPATAHGKDDATVDIGLIRKWWDRTPEANVAIATGAASGLVVLDVDPRHGGFDSIEDLEARFGRLPETPVSLTGGGGTHSVFQRPSIVTIPCRTNLGGFPGIDLKADGGYVIASPSIHPNGRRYEWSPALHPSKVPLAEAPGWLLELAQAGPATEPTTRRYVAADWDGALPVRVAHLLRADPRIRARFRRVPGDHADQSPSGVDASLAHLLARRGLSGAEIEAAIRASRAQAGLPSRPDSYFRTTVGKALGGLRA
jgi:hypothetical protein